MRGEGLDVFRPFSEWTYEHRENLKSKVEIFPEAASLRLGPEVTVRGSDDSNVDVDFTGFPDRTDRLGLDGAKELRLAFERKLRKLVDEKRAAVRLPKKARAIAVSAGKSTPLVSEELALE
jgi:hypothetical protein